MDPYSMARNISKLFLQGLQGQKNLELSDIREQVDTACQSPVANELNAEGRERLIRELESEYETVIGAERQLLGADEGWEPWLHERRGELNWKYWQRYQDYLATGAFTDDVLARMDSSTDRLLGLLGDPKREGSWDRRGLIVGLVQSGKTAHYVGAINKAIDSGYRVIVVLTGFTESLRVQTQDRLEKGVLGYSLMPDPTQPRQMLAIACGVEHLQPIRPRLDSVTTRRNDFKTGIANNFAIQVGGNPIVFVVKKNATVLKNLLQWVTNFGNAIDSEGRGYVKDVPLLVIDDESDVGSIDTKKGGVDETGEVNQDHDPTKLNKQIRKLLSLFDQSSYVGYTATPFANVLIHDLKEAGIDPVDKLKIGEDLFPRSFIISLPTPSNHVGPSMVFGTTRDSEVLEGLPILRDIDDTQIGDEKDDFWMPNSHRKEHVPVFKGQDRIPDSLQEAMLSFILVCAARLLRGDEAKHNSMLVHVTRFVDVQKRVFDQIERYLLDVVSRLRNKTAHTDLLDRFRDLWESGERSFVQTTKEIAKRPEIIFQNEEHSWVEIEPLLIQTASSIQVRTINGQAGDVLDYIEHSNGLNVIAIGGDKLARGLTLEGLSVSYFLRSSRMYDTLMQMGRWFGYRPRYVDLCRLYTTKDLSGWFSHISAATEELRDEFELMANSAKTPKEFGLRVRSHPQMLVTSAVKMRDGTQIQVSFQGTLVQTIDFGRTVEAVEHNWRAGQTLVEKIEGDSGIVKAELFSNAVSWSGVPSDAVIEFLKNYQEHKAARTVKTSALGDYIENQNNKNNLTNWLVLLSGTGRTDYPAELGETKLGCNGRSWHVSSTLSIADLIKSDHYRIGVLAEPEHERVGLSDTQIQRALRLDIDDWEETGGIRRGKNVKRPEQPGGAFLRQVRGESEGLLILYPLSPDQVENEEKAEKTDTPILGFAMSFPKVGNVGDSLISYVVSNVYQREKENE